MSSANPVSTEQGSNYVVFDNLPSKFDGISVFNTGLNVCSDYPNNFFRLYQFLQNGTRLVYTGVVTYRKAWIPRDAQTRHYNNYNNTIGYFSDDHNDACYTLTDKVFVSDPVFIWTDLQICKQIIQLEWRQIKYIQSHNRELWMCLLENSSGASIDFYATCPTDILKTLLSCKMKFVYVADECYQNPDIMAHACRYGHFQNFLQPAQECLSRMLMRFPLELWKCYNGNKYTPITPVANDIMQKLISLSICNENYVSRSGVCSPNCQAMQCASFNELPPNIDTCLLCAYCSNSGINKTVGYMTICPKTTPVVLSSYVWLVNKMNAGPIETCINEFEHVALKYLNAATYNFVKTQHINVAQLLNKPSPYHILCNKIIQKHPDAFYDIIDVPTFLMYFTAPLRHMCGYVINLNVPVVYFVDDIKFII